LIQDTPLRPLTRFQMALMTLGSVSMGMGFAVNFVVLAPLTRQAGLSEIQVAFVMTASSIVYTLMTPRWGRLAQRIGRKRVMAFSMFAMAGTNVAFLFTLQTALAGVITGLSAFFALAFVRVWFGVLAPGHQPASMAAMTDATTPSTRASGLGMLGAGMNIGSIAGPAITVLLAPFGALMPLWGAVAFMVFCGLMISIYLPTDKPDATQTTRPMERLSLKDARIRPHFLFLLSYFIGVGMVQQTIGWFVEDRYKFTATADQTAAEAAVAATGAIFACSAITAIITQFGYIARVRPDPKRILPIGLGLIAIGYICADLFFPFWALCLSFGIVGIGGAISISSANAIATFSVPRDEQGAAAAFMATAGPAGFVIGPVLGALLYQLSPKLPMLGMAIVAAILTAQALMVTSRKD
jgi:MFS family permease